MDRASTIRGPNRSQAADWSALPAMHTPTTRTKTHPAIRLLFALTVGGLLAQLPFWPTLALGTFLMLWLFHIVEG